LVEVENTSNMAVPDADENGATSVITIAEAGTIDQLVLDLNIEHTYAGDLMVTLTHAGTTVNVFDGDQTDDPSGDDVNLSDKLLEEFAGADMKGDWELKIVDRAKYDEGTLTNWKLSVVTR
jgi:subtilisin-like proprotein convertase family protein